MTDHADTQQANHDALRAAAALGWLIRWAARLLLAALIVWLYATPTPDMTPWHWAAATTGIPLAWAATPTKETT